MCKRLTHSYIVLLLSLAMGCGKGDLVFKIESPGQTELFSCVPGSDPEASPLRRLSDDEYRNTLKDTLGTLIYGELAGDVALLPADTVPGRIPVTTYASQNHTDAYFEIAWSAAHHIVIGTPADPNKYIKSIAGVCMSSDATADAACLDRFVRSFGLKTHRRPLTDVEVASYKAFYNADLIPRTQKIERLVALFLTSPDFIYHPELNGSKVNGRGDLLALNDYEIASRLSYLAWGTMPDRDLFDAAAAGKLSDPLQFETQAQLVFNSNKTKLKVRRFYEHWLMLKEVPDFGYTASFLGGVASTDLRGRMIEETLDYTDYITWTEEGDYGDLLTSDKSIVKLSNLGQIYGVAPSTAPDGVVTFTDPFRRGLLTKGAMLAKGMNVTNPILRGVAIRRQILCDELPSPNPDALPDRALEPPELNPTMTTRQRVEAKTADTQCMICHSKINPLGFAMERFDGVGRTRTQETLYHSETGLPVGTVPLNTWVQPKITSRDQQGVDGPVELQAAILASGKGEACITKQWFRQFAGRMETKTDGCHLIGMYESLTAEDGSIKDMLFKTMNSQQFKLRKIAP